MLTASSPIMSAGPIYIHTLIAKLSGPAGTIVCPVTEPDDAEQWQEPSELDLWTRQGPLESGKVRNMGTTQAMFDHVWSEYDSADAARLVRDTKELELQVTAVYGPEDIMVAARRRERRQIVEVLGTPQQIHTLEFLSTWWLRVPPRDRKGQSIAGHCRACRPPIQCRDWAGVKPIADHLATGTALQRAN